jgi:hypothetical protein
MNRNGLPVCPTPRRGRNDTFHSIAQSQEWSMTTTEKRVTQEEQERLSLVRCATDAFESLKMIPDLDPNGPILVWMSEHLHQTQRKDEPKETSSPPR